MKFSPFTDRSRSEQILMNPAVELPNTVLSLVNDYIPSENFEKFYLLRILRIIRILFIKNSNILNI